MYNKTCKSMDDGRVFVPQYTCLIKFKIKFRTSNAHQINLQNFKPTK